MSFETRCAKCGKKLGRSYNLNGVSRTCRVKLLKKLIINLNTYFLDSHKNNIMLYLKAGIELNH